MGFSKNLLLDPAILDLDAKMQKRNLELRCLLTTYRKLCKLNWAFQRILLLDPYDPRWLRSAILKIDMKSFFLLRLVQFG